MKPQCSQVSVVRDVFWSSSFPEWDSVRASLSGFRFGPSDSRNCRAAIRSALREDERSQGCGPAGRTFSAHAVRRYLKREFFSVRCAASMGSGSGSGLAAVLT
jgi:hypothetical protein